MNPFTHICNTSSDKPTIDPGEGYRLLGEDEPWQADDQTYWLSKGKWYTLTDTNSHVGNPTSRFRVTNPLAFRNSDGSPDYLFVRRKITDPIATLTSEVEKARAALAAVEAKLKEATEIKAGDWVVAVKDCSAGSTPLENRPYLVEKVGSYSSGSTVLFLDHATKATQNGWSASRFRKALAHEVERHLKANPPIPPLPELHGHKGVYSKDANVVVYGCAHINVNLLRTVSCVNHLSSSKDGNRTLASITLDSGKTLTISDIRAILAHTDHVNCH